MKLMTLSLAARVLHIGSLLLCNQSQFDLNPRKSPYKSRESKFVDWVYLTRHPPRPAINTNLTRRIHDICTRLVLVSRERVPCLRSEISAYSSIIIIVNTLF